MSKYDQQVKALLIGVCLHSRRSGNGSFIKDAAREEKLTSAADRLTIDPARLTPSTLKEMLGNGEEILKWLAKHPKAEVNLGYWWVTIKSDVFSDVDWDSYDTPFPINGGVECFTKTQKNDKWVCEWVLC